MGKGVGVSVYLSNKLPELDEHYVLIYRTFPIMHQTVK